MGVLFQSVDVTAYLRWKYDHAIVKSEDESFLILADGKEILPEALWSRWNVRTDLSGIPSPLGGRRD